MDRNASHCQELFEQISSFLEGDLAPRSCAELRSHLEGCAACRVFLESLRSTREALNAVARAPEIDGPECEALLRECLQQVMARAEASPEAPEGGA